MTNKTNMRAHGNSGSLTAVIFSQHILGLGTRKTSIVFFAEALARQGWNVKFVTVQLSYLSYLVKNPRLFEVPPGDLNAWRCRGENLDNYVWLPPVHPATLPSQLLNSASAFLARLYPLLLHHSIKEEVVRANMVIIESCAAIALFSKLKTIARNAKFVYFCNDRLSAIGMHPVLQKILTRTAPLYDLIRTNSTDLLKDFPPRARAEYIPQGLDKRSFNISTTSPYEGSTTNIVIAGDMAFDASAVKAVLEQLPDVDIHAFGRNRTADLLPYPRFHHHGEMAFSSLLPYIKHADAGFAPYSARPGMDYLAESSLKLIQYSYARLPIIAPYFANHASTRARSPVASCSSNSFASAAMASGITFRSTE